MAKPRIDDGTRVRIQTKMKGEPAKTQQSQKAQCDVNLIVAQFMKTGQITHLNQRTPNYGDFSSGTTYQEALDQVSLAQDAFDELPAAIRNRMNNDPAELLDFLANPENTEEAQEMGLLPKPSAEMPPTIPDPTPETEPKIQGEIPPA